MFQKLTVATAAFAMLGGVALATPDHWLDDAEMQTELHGWATEQAVDPWTPPADFALAPGEQLPPEAQTHPFVDLPIHPEIENVEYVTVDGSTVVVDAQTREIVAVID